MREDRVFSVSAHAQTPVTETTERRIFEPATGLETIVYPEVQAKSTFRWTGAELERGAAARLTRSSECLRNAAGEPASAAAGHTVERGERIGGFATVVQRSAGSGVTLWLAPELGCELLHQIRVEKAADGTEQRSKFTLDRVVPGNPDPALFETGAYAEMKPSEVYVKRAAHVGGSAADPEAMRKKLASSSMAQMDRRYAEHRP